MQAYREAHPDLAEEYDAWLSDSLPDGWEDAVPVFEGTVEIAVPVVSKVDEGTSITFEIEVRYQACTERECFIPRTRRLRLEVPVAPLNRPRRD